MILDGYTERMKVDGALVEFRPMLQAERLHLLGRAAQASNIHEVYRQAIGAHVWFCDVPDLEPTAELLMAVLGIGRSREEQADADNLYWGTILSLRYPHLQRVSCETCRTFHFDPVSGRFAMRGKKRALRPPGDSLLCETREGCPKGNPEVGDQRTLSPKNQAALAHDLECRAVGKWPDDPIVRRNARVIGHALRRVKHGSP